MAKGEAEAEDGAFTEAIKSFGKAWDDLRHDKILLPILAQNGLVQWSFIGDPGQEYIVQVSTNLPDWATLATIKTDQNGVATFSDPTSSAQGARFYRIHIP